MVFEVTKLVYGEEALKVRKASEEIFSNMGNFENTETVSINKEVLENGINVVDV